MRVGLGHNITSGIPDSACYNAKSCLDAGSIVGRSTNITSLDIVDFPRDGRLHQVVVEIAVGTVSPDPLLVAGGAGSLKLFIDEELKGSVALRTRTWIDSTMGLHSFGVKALDNDIPVGEPNEDWPSETSEYLHIYDASNKNPFCDKSILLGSRLLDLHPKSDWVTAPETAWEEVRGQT